MPYDTDALGAAQGTSGADQCNGLISQPEVTKNATQNQREQSHGAGLLPRTGEIDRVVRRGHSA